MLLLCYCAAHWANSSLSETVVGGGSPEHSCKGSLLPVPSVISIGDKNVRREAFGFGHRKGLRVR